MVVGEPTLMGGEFGDEDERLITRLENTQFEPNNADDDLNQSNLSAAASGSGGVPNAEHLTVSVHYYLVDNRLSNVCVIRYVMIRV